MTDIEHVLLGHLCWEGCWLARKLAGLRARAVLQMIDLPVQDAAACVTAGYRVGALREDVLAIEWCAFQLNRLAKEFVPALCAEISDLEVAAAQLANGCNLAELELKYRYTVGPQPTPAAVIAEAA